MLPISTNHQDTLKRPRLSACLHHPNFPNPLPDRYKNNVETYETMKQDLSIIKKVVTEHSEKLQKLA